MADWATISALGTAAGTLVLAVATFAGVFGQSLSVQVHGDDPTAEVLAAVAGRDLSGAIVKLEVHLLDSNQSAFQESRVRAALRETYHLSLARSVDRGDRLLAVAEPAHLPAAPGRP